jgi:hypothetical protein
MKGIKMHLSKVNEALDHKITGGAEFQWNCWPEARYLDYESEYAHASVIFDTRTQEVLCAEVNDKADQHNPYRWMNPDYNQVYLDEAKERNVDPNLAWDKKYWYDLEITEDWLVKARAIMRGEDFDTRIQVPLTLNNDELFKLMTMAHERDITLNKMVEVLLQEVIDRNKNE